MTASWEWANHHAAAAAARAAGYTHVRTLGGWVTVGEWADRLQPVPRIVYRFMPDGPKGPAIIDAPADLRFDHTGAFAYWRLAKQP